jgi:pyruvate dehydrogenase E2 component (dihydrolipoamide acetyltransferase)
MANWEFKLPDIGEGVTEGEIVKWLVQPNELVKEDQPMVEVMTDKATVTITSPRTGRIVETRGAVGGIVPVHSVLVVFDLGGGAAAHDAPPVSHGHVDPPVHGPAHVPASDPVSSGKSDGPAATAVGDIKEDLPGMSLMMGSSSAPVAAAPRVEVAAAARAPQATDYFNAKPLATPATRKLARDLGVDLRKVAPTGSNGRVTKDDVRAPRRGSRERRRAAAGAPRHGSRAAEPPCAPRRRSSRSRSARSSQPGASGPPASPAVASASARPPVSIARDADQERIPLRGVRKRIFDGMMRSKHTAAHFTFVEECDATSLKELRARLRPSAEKQGVKLTFLPFFVKACVAALKKMPALNASFDESTQEIVQHRRYHIGIASATEAGLIVPVVRDADRKSLLDIARDIARLGEDTKTGKVRPEDLGGSTFTITSLGAQGGLFATPILNFPEVAILGVHQMKEKPVVKDGQIVIGNVMLLSLSFDHRIIDGHIGAQFAVRDHRLPREPGPPVPRDGLRPYSACSILAMVCSCMLLVPS